MKRLVARSFMSPTANLMKSAAPKFSTSKLARKAGQMWNLHSASADAITRAVPDL
jgi:hypothetical protein